MRTLICEGIRAFIVVESRLFLLGVEVFSIWDSTSSLSERGEQGFPYRGDLLSACVSSKITLVLGFPYWDSRAFLGNER